MNKEQMNIIMSKFENDKRSLDDVIGYIIRKSHEDYSSNTISYKPEPLGYNSVTTVIRYLREYFDIK